MSMNTGKHKIWICIRKKHIFVKLTDKKMDNIFAIYRGSGKKNRALVRKRSKIKRALIQRRLRLVAYMSDFGGVTVFLEFRISEELYRKLKDEADQNVLEYERENYDEESMVF